MRSTVEKQISLPVRPQVRSLSGVCLKSRQLDNTSKCNTAFGDPNSHLHKMTASFQCVTMLIIIIISFFICSFIFLIPLLYITAVYLRTLQLRHLVITGLSFAFRTTSIQHGIDSTMMMTACLWHQKHIFHPESCHSIVLFLL